MICLCEVTNANTQIPLTSHYNETLVFWFVGQRQRKIIIWWCFTADSVVYLRAFPIRIRAAAGGMRTSPARNTCECPAQPSHQPVNWRPDVTFDPRRFIARATVHTRSEAMRRTRRNRSIVRTITSRHRCEQATMRNNINTVIPNIIIIRARDTTTTL
jgi:hypothetical protein